MPEPDLLLMLTRVLMHSPEPCGNQSAELFDVLLRDRIAGLPSHIMSMSITIDINENLTPYIQLTRGITDAKGTLLAEEGSIKRVDERYSLVVVAGCIAATLEK